MKQATKLFFGGRIHTMSPDQPEADAMLVEDDRIAWIGTSHELSAVPSDSYDLVDLDGCTILPGLIDSHLHLFLWCRSLAMLNLAGTRSLSDLLKLLKQAGRTARGEKRQRIMGTGLNRVRWRGSIEIRKSDLDKAIPDRPVLLASKDEHTYWVNSRTLELARINRDTPDPDGGVIERDKTGEPNGVLREQAAWNVLGLQPIPKGREARRLLEAGCAELLKRGCVAVSNFDRIEAFGLLQQLDAEGKLPIRVVQYLPVDVLDSALDAGLRSGFGSEHLCIGGIKLFADGALGSQSALMKKPYLGQPGNRGIAVMSREELVNSARRAARAGLASAIHAIGDQANSNALDALAVCRQGGARGLRHRIEHCQIMDAADVKRFKELNIVASMQPSHAVADIALMNRYLGRRRYHSYRFRSLRQAGVALAFGSDAPIEPPDPLSGIGIARTGKLHVKGECFNRNQLLSPSASLHGFTLGGAVAVGHEKWRGSLEFGKKADFIVVDRDPLRSKMEELVETEVVATYIDGKLRYSLTGFGG